MSISAAHEWCCCCYSRCLIFVCLGFALNEKNASSECKCWVGQTDTQINTLTSPSRIEQLTKVKFLKFMLRLLSNCRFSGGNYAVVDFRGIERPSIVRHNSWNNNRAHLNSVSKTAYELQSFCVYALCVCVMQWNANAKWKSSII